MAHLISSFYGVGDEGGDGLLTVVEVHEAANFPAHVLLVAGVFEEAG